MFQFLDSCFMFNPFAALLLLLLETSIFTAVYLTTWHPAVFYRWKQKKHSPQNEKKPHCWNLLLKHIPLIKQRPYCNDKQFSFPSNHHFLFTSCPRANQKPTWHNRDDMDQKETRYIYVTLKLTKRFFFFITTFFSHLSPSISLN